MLKKLFFTSLSLLFIGNIHAQSDSSEAAADSVNTEPTKKATKELPLEPERQIELKNPTVTWISLDISPDGRSIYFDALGDLYKMPIGGGKAEALTQGLAYEVHPRISPDGKSLVYISDKSGSQNIWVMDLESKEDRQITKDKNQNYFSADWSPDGTYIVGAKGRRNIKLHLYHQESGSGAQIIKKPANLKAIDPFYSPDGEHIYFSKRRGAWDYNAQLPQYQIGRYDMEDGEVHTITSRYGSAFTPTLSPDGKYLVYGSRFEDETGLVLRNLETGDEDWLAYPVQRDEQESIAPLGVLPGMSFDPSGQELYCSYGGEIWAINIQSKASRKIPMELDMKLDLGPRLDFKYPISDEIETPINQIRDGVPSPNGEWLAFTALNRLYLYNFNTKKVERIAANQDFTQAMPAWAPNGKTLAYATWEGKEGHIYQIKVGSKKAQRLSQNPGLYKELCFSPDGKKLVFIRQKSQSYRDAYSPFVSSSDAEIAYLDLRTKKQSLIAEAEGRGRPHFDTKGERIYLNSMKGLVSIRWDGSDEKEHLKLTGITTYGSSLESFHDHKGGHDMLPAHEDAWRERNKPSSASLMFISPDGNSVLAQINNDLYEVHLPFFGQKAEISVANPKSAAFPARKLTTMGGEFPAWSADGNKIHWSLGPAHFVYDLSQAQAFEDSVAAAKKAEKEAAKNVKDEDKAEEGDKKEESKKKKEKQEEAQYEAEEILIPLTYKKDIPQGTVLLKGARLITMKGDEVIEKGDLLIRNNRILKVGPSGSFDVPAEAQVIDCAGKTISPGLIDTHSHMWPNWNIHKNQVWLYAANLAYGVTTTRDPQTATTDVLTYGDMVEAGMIEGPRIYSTGPGVGFWAYNIKSLDHARKVLKQYSEYYRTKTIKMYLTGNRQQRQWIIMACKELELKPTTEGGLDFKLNMTQIMDGYPGHEHALPIHPIYGDVVEFVAQSKSTVTPTMLVAYGGPFAENYFYATEEVYHDPKMQTFTPYEELAGKSRRRGSWFMEEEHVFPKHAEFIKALVDAGGLAGVGSHGQLQGLGYHWELWAMASGGLSNLQAMQVATIHGAESLGLDGDLGSIEEGKIADLVIYAKNPLEDIRNTNTIDHVVKNGRVYDGDNLDRIAPDAEKAEEFLWQFAKPSGLPGINE